MPPFEASSDGGLARRRPSWTREPALTVGVIAWLAIMILYWPGGLSFQDDVGYVGETRILHQGRLRPLPNDPGVWVSTTRGSISQYPLLPSLLLLPFLATVPKTVFVVGMSAAVALCLIASRILKSWGSGPTWALLLIAHPTVAIVARTTMADLPLSAFALGAWWSLRQHHRVATVLLFAALIATKPTGVLLGLALGGGEILRLFSTLRWQDPEARDRALTAVIGVVVGFLVVFATNEMTTGGLWFAYDHSFLGTPPFWPCYLPRTGSAHLRTFLFFPPLLILGMLPWWRRSEIGPLCVIFGFGTMMCFYFFVDFGTTPLESMTLAPRLILPAVTFLLVGYADLLSRAVRRFSLTGRLTAPLLVVGTATIALTISIRHHRWQKPMAEALAAASQAAESVHAHELGVTPEAAKAGMLFSGPTHLVGRTDADTAVVLCSTRSASYRQPDDGPYSCALRGYHPYRSVGDYQVLIREPPTAGLRGQDDLVRKAQ